MNIFFLRIRLKTAIFLWLTCCGFSALGENSYSECQKALFSPRSERQICSLVFHRDKTITSPFHWGVLLHPKTTKTYRIDYLYAALHYRNGRVQTYDIMNPDGSPIQPIDDELSIFKVTPHGINYESLKLFFWESYRNNPGISIHPLDNLQFPEETMDSTLVQILHYNQMFFDIANIRNIDTHSATGTLKKFVLQRTLLCENPKKHSNPRHVSALCYYEGEQENDIEKSGAENLLEPQSMIQRMTIDPVKYTGF